MCQALPIFSELETFRSKEDFILATLQQVDIKENTFQKGASLSGKRSRYANTKQLKWWEGRKRRLWQHADDVLPRGHFSASSRF